MRALIDGYNREENPPRSSLRTELDGGRVRLEIGGALASARCPAEHLPAGELAGCRRRVHARPIAHRIVSAPGVLAA